jgi:hypothetical protein
MAVFGAIPCKRAIGSNRSGTFFRRPDPYLRAAAVHQVKHRGILRHLNRQLELKGHGRGPKADARGLRGDLGEDHEE